MIFPKQQIAGIVQIAIDSQPKAFQQRFWVVRPFRNPAGIDSVSIKFAELCFIYCLMDTPESSASHESSNFFKIIVHPLYIKFTLLIQISQSNFT